jgi:DNA-binding GntR family transcriptional regulator
LLRALVLDSELSPGERLRIEHLSRRFKVSQTPVREALNRLAAEGLVVQEAYRGFRVSQLLDPVELVQLQAAREAIEVAAVEKISMPRVVEALPKLNALVEEMGNLGAESKLNIKAFNAADAEFHRLTVAAANNRFLLEAFDALHVHVQIARHYQGKSVEEAILSNDEHRQIANLLGEGERLRASRVVRQHIRGVADRLAFGAEEREVAR